jgi:hypothetical protein
MFNKFKENLAALGVEGIETAKDLKEIEAIVGKLEGQTLKRAEKEIAKARKGLKKMGDTADAIHENMQ